jgi:hypothetical protein
MGTALAAECEHLAKLYHDYTTNSLFEGTAFQAGGWMPLTLALAWFAFGIAAGAAIRRTMPALAVTCAAFLGRTILMQRLRPYFMKPLTQTKSFFDGSKAAGPASVDASRNDMSISGHNALFLDSQGHTHSTDQVMSQWCAGTGQSRNAPDLTACLKQHDIVGSLVTYQPASRLGTFHVIENCANLGLMVLSLVAAWWCVRTARTTT